MRTAIIMFVLVATATVAHSYPQWQLARDTTCTSCHLAPDGSGLLNENGLTTAETVAWRGQDPTFMYGNPELPSWLVLGGDVRIASGVVDAREMGGAFFPMQAEVAAAVLVDHFSVHALVGFRRPNPEASAIHALWSREHYVMWRQKPDEGRGLYVRAGRFQPTFGLRLAEHVVYTQRFGGRPLYHEAYGVSLAYVDTRAEIHATAFLADRIGSAPEKGDGGAVYGELRLGERAAVGLQGKYASSDDLTRLYGGVTGKLYLQGPDVMLLGEAQLIRRELSASGFTQNQLAAFVMAVRPLPAGLQLDVGIGHYTQDLDVEGLYRDAIDVNLHWFATSHVELLLTTRVEIVGGGDSEGGGYALGQLHYRL